MKRFATVLTVLLMSAAVPAFAGSFGVYGSYWDSDIESVYGGGIRVGFNFLKWMELEFHGTYFTDMSEEDGGVDVEVSTIPVDGGLRFNFLHDRSVNPYAGAGVTYWILDADEVEIDDEFGYYAEAGVEFGKRTRFFAEAQWRILEANVDDGIDDEDIDFDGFGINAGVNWRW